MQKSFIFKILIYHFNFASGSSMRIAEYGLDKYDCIIKCSDGTEMLYLTSGPLMHFMLLICDVSKHKTYNAHAQRTLVSQHCTINTVMLHIS